MRREAHGALDTCMYHAREGEGVELPEKGLADCFWYEQNKFLRGIT